MVPRISIITPWLDHPEFIADYENAVRATGIEVIVIDNGSASANATALSAMVGRLGAKYIRNEENRWFSGANNQGLAIATGEVVLFLNNDISSEKPWLDDVRRDVVDGNLCGPALIHQSAAGIQIDYIEGWCVAARRQVWQALGGWNESAFPMPYCEDAELSVRAARSGIRLVQTAWPVAHKGRGTTQAVPAVCKSLDQNSATLVAMLRGEPAAPTPPPAARHLLPLAEYLRLARLPDAERDYRAAVEREPRRPDLWIAYGAVLRACGRYEAAINSFQRAAQIDPTLQTTALREVGIALGTAQRHVEAIEVLTQVVRRAPGSASAHHDLATALARAGHYQEAIEAGRAAVALDPKCAAAYATTSDAHFNLGENLPAIEAARAAIRLEPTNLLANYALGRALRAVGNVAEALAVFERMVTDLPFDALLLRERDELRVLLKTSSVRA